MPMSTQLRITIGQYSDKGRKRLNQDFYGLSIPEEPQFSTKGIVIALADGISSSDVSQVASETSIKGFLGDYYSTPDSWSVKTSVQRVLQATNSWLYAQSRNGPYRYDIDRGYVCTLSALVLKSTTAHLFHAGDTRIYRCIDDKLEQLTEDHRLWISHEKSYLSRALGMRERLEIDYRSQQLEVGDLFILATDGVYEFVSDTSIAETIRNHRDDLDKAARMIVKQAYHSNSSDNMSIQIIRIDELPQRNIAELSQHACSLPFPPDLQPRMTIDGYEILRELYNSSRSHIYLAVDRESGKQLTLKTPSTSLRNDAAYLERFLMEEWVARRIDSAHVLKSQLLTRKRNYLYLVSEYIDGKTLTQWMKDNPNPDIETVRKLVEQTAKGLQSLHRQEMLHQDLRPDNIMIDKAGTLKIIDFGSVRVAGVAELKGMEQQQILGTALYTAPEYFLGEAGTTRSDMFSLGVICYQLLSNRLPYGTQVAKATTRAAQRKLTYRSILDDNRTIPAWIDEAIKKAVHPSPHMRYDTISEFLHDLREPNVTFLRRSRPPLLERNPVLFWQGVSLTLLLIVLYLLRTGPVTSSHSDINASSAPVQHAGVSHIASNHAALFNLKPNTCFTLTASYRNTCIAEHNLLITPPQGRRNSHA